MLRKGYLARVEAGRSCKIRNDCLVNVQCNKGATMYQAKASSNRSSTYKSKNNANAKSQTRAFVGSYRFKFKTADVLSGLERRNATTLAACVWCLKDTHMSFKIKKKLLETCGL